MSTIISILLALLLPFAKGEAQNSAIMPTTSPLETDFEPGTNPLQFSSEGELIAATLFLPEAYQAGDQLPVVIVEGPWTQVKEQLAYRYATDLSEQGIAALALDHRYWGESGGSPRFLESSSAKVEDLRNAISFLQQLSLIAEDEIFLLGVCAGAGTVAQTAAMDNRIAGMVTVAAWLQHPSTSPLFYGGEQGVAELIDLAENAANAYLESGEMPYVAAYDPEPGSGAAMAFPSDYYGSANRGAIAEWNNQFAVAGWKEWLELNTIDGVADRIDSPVLMIHSDQSALPDNVRRFYDQVNGPKQLVWGEGAHTDFYDQDQQLDFVINQLVSFILSRSAQ
ncbi:MAG: alpha/beta hydrolase [Bacteroidota bacterium]